MTVQTMNDIKGYLTLSVRDKILSVITLQKYLSSIDTQNRNLDILRIKKGKKCFIFDMIEDDNPFSITLEIETIKQFKSRVKNDRIL